MNFIADTSFYRIGYSEAKNRVYIDILGYWEDIEESGKNYLNHLITACDMAKPSFSILVNILYNEIQPKEYRSFHEKAQIIVKEKGVGKVAEVFPQNDFFYMQSELIRKNSKLPRSKFGDRVDAEDWLDEPDVDF